MGVQERRQREFQRREEEILDATLALLAGDDWQTLTIDQVARAAEVAKGTVYLHVESKDELFARLALRRYRPLAAALEQLPTDAPGLAQIAAIIRTYWTHHTSLGRDYQRALQPLEREGFVAQLPERTRREVEAVSGRIVAVVHRALARGIADGALADRPMPLLVFQAQSALLGAIRQYWTGCVPAAQTDAYREAMTAFILAGLAPAPAAPVASPPRRSQGPRARETRARTGG